MKVKGRQLGAFGRAGEGEGQGRIPTGQGGICVSVGKNYFVLLSAVNSLRSNRIAPRGWSQIAQEGVSVLDDISLPSGHRFAPTAMMGRHLQGLVVNARKPAGSRRFK